LKEREMKKELFDELLTNATQAAAHAQGKKVKGARSYKIRVPEVVDVRAVRKKLGMTREDFAKTFGFSASGVSKWENGDRVPEGPARVLLKMISKDAALVLRLAR